ncbi:MAG TPA: sigma 54-interacting transcriptional regulator [Acidobacteriaceae bacterium]
MTAMEQTRAATRPIPGMPGVHREALPARSGRVAVLASADVELRGRVARLLTGMRWQVHEAAGGAELFAMMEPGELAAGVVLLDSWLPDLDVSECVRELQARFAGVDVLALDGTDVGATPARGAFRNEVLHALRVAQQSDEAVWLNARSEGEILAASGVAPRAGSVADSAAGRATGGGGARRGAGAPEGRPEAGPQGGKARGREEEQGDIRPEETRVQALPELIGSDSRMLEVSRRIRLVAPRQTAVLIEGPTGTGKELVARALHRLSPRASRPFVVLNCAAIPEALLEAELFGHTRGAFTGAVQGRVGRVEAAHGGTLFLDEIGELPLTLQAKLLRFVECGEVQRVGENEPVRVDVRIVAATHRKLGQMAAAGTFRADLYYRLSVFLIRTPALGDRPQDIALLAHHALARLARKEPAKILAPEAMRRLVAHSWPGNVRELEHTLERSWILAAERPLIQAGDIDFAGEVGD